MSEFDPLHAPLKGVTVVEASAGTGKTYNICVLYLRLIIEKNLLPSQILVLTFTKAASSELKQRIKSHLVNFFYELKNKSSLAKNDLLSCYAAELFKENEAFEDNFSTNNIDHEVIIQRLRNAINGFDNASIYTIHGFCQKLLVEGTLDEYFSSGFNVLKDDLSLCRNLAARFWREKIDILTKESKEFSAWLFNMKIGPNELAELLKIRLQHRSSFLISSCDKNVFLSSGQVIDSLSSKIKSCASVYFRLALLWDKSSSEAYSILSNANGSLAANIYKQTTINNAFNAWARYIKYNSHWINTTSLDERSGKPYLLSNSFIISKTRKGKPPIEHPIFIAIEHLLSLLKDVQSYFLSEWMKISDYWLQIAPEELMSMKRRSFKLTFDDLLIKVNSLLSERAELSELLKTRFPAALIDEFQDTNSEQYEMIQRIYLSGGRFKSSKHSHLDEEELLGLEKKYIKVNKNNFSLFLFGDPKQSIYAFRGADISSYFLAKESAEYFATLTKNWRANLALTYANNRLFSINREVFIESKLKFIESKYKDSLSLNTKDLQFTNHSADAKKYEVVGNVLPLSEDCLHIWLLPFGSYHEDGVFYDEKYFLSRAEAINASAKATADEICRLLNSEAHKPFSGKKNLAAEIAVLVRTNRQGDLMRVLLKKRGVNALFCSRESIFITEEAENIEVLFRAINSPNDLRLIKAALMSDWLKIDTWTDDFYQTDKFLHFISLFNQLKNICQNHGFTSMWFAMFNLLGLYKKIKESLTADRCFANINYLGELLFQAVEEIGVGANIITKLIKWLKKQRHILDVDKYPMRLEGDANYVQILTIHQSKGLEFPIVFCPFLFDLLPKAEKKYGASNTRNFLGLYNFRIAGKTYQSLALSIHDAYQRLLQAGLNLPIEENEYIEANKENEQSTQKEKVECYLSRESYLEEMGENIRLIYVAMTRASRRCYLVAGIFTMGLKRSTTNASHSSLNWLLHSDQKDLVCEEIISLWRNLASPFIKIKPLPISHPVIFLNNVRKANFPCEPSYQVKDREILPSWFVHSFTKLTNYRYGKSSGLNWQDKGDISLIPSSHYLSDDGRKKELTDEISSPETSENLPNEDSSIAYFPDLFLPLGIASGIFLHQLYEAIFLSSHNNWSFILKNFLKKFEYKWRIFAKSLSEKKAWQTLTSKGWPENFYSIFFYHITILGSYDLNVSKIAINHFNEEQKKNFVNPVCLANLSGISIATEFPFTFYFRAEQLVITQNEKNFSRANLLTILLEGYSYPIGSLKLSHSIFTSIEGGFIKGVIDLIFCAEGRYYLIDWKTNHLRGENDSEISNFINLTMIEHSYWLQGILYSLALHRYLRQIIANYDYEKHFGGMYFIFVRGFFEECNIEPSELMENFVPSFLETKVNNNQDKKFSKYVIADRPPFLLIDALDKLFVC